MQQLKTAKEHGFSFFLVKGEDKCPAFLYSVGMAAKGLPDVLMFLDSTYAKPQIAMVTQFLQRMLSALYCLQS